MADDKNGDALLLCEPQQHTGRLSHLGYAARRRRHGRVEHRLDRVDHADLRLLRERRIRDDIKIRLAEKFQILPGAADASCPKADLAERLLPGHIENPVAALREISGDLKKQRRLADARISSHQQE